MYPTTKINNKNMSQYVMRDETTLVEDKFKWYALNCFPNQEKTIRKTIETNLRLNNLTGFVEQMEIPTEKVLINVKGKKIQREKVVMSGYILMKADISNGEVIPTIRRTQGVIGFLNPTDGKLSKIPEPMKISEVERFLQITLSVADKPQIKNYNKGDKVSIIDGSFAGFNGVIESVDYNKKTLCLLVSIFSRETSVYVNFEQISSDVVV